MRIMMNKNEIKNEIIKNKGKKSAVASQSTDETSVHVSILLYRGVHLFYLWIQIVNNLASLFLHRVPTSEQTTHTFLSSYKSLYWLTGLLFSLPRTFGNISAGRFGTHSIGVGSGPGWRELPRLRIKSAVDGNPTHGFVQQRRESRKAVARSRTLGQLTEEQRLKKASYAR